MGGNESKDTHPELETRRFLHRRRLRFRQSFAIELESARAKVDMFPCLRLAVFIDSMASFLHSLLTNGRR